MDRTLHTLNSCIFRKFPAHSPYIIIWVSYFNECSIQLHHLMASCKLATMGTHSHDIVFFQLLYNIAMESVFSYWLALTFQASHVVSEVKVMSLLRSQSWIIIFKVEWPKPDPKDLMVHRDW